MNNCDFALGASRTSLGHKVDLVMILVDSRINKIRQYGRFKNLSSLIMDFDVIVQGIDDGLKEKDMGKMIFLVENFKVDYLDNQIGVNFLTIWRKNPGIGEISLTFNPL